MMAVEDLPASIVLRATDAVGNATTCQLTFVAIGATGAFPHDNKLQAVPRARHFVSFQNAPTPGSRRSLSR